jgi:hypothetical protein
MYRLGRKLGTECAENILKNHVIVRPSVVARFRFVILGLIEGLFGVGLGSL